MLENLLLIKNPSLNNLESILKENAFFFLTPLFTISLTLEFLGNFEFEKVLKKLLIATLFLFFFSGIHKEVSTHSLKFSYDLLKKIGPDHFIHKKWYQSKGLKKKGLVEKESFFDSFKIIDLDDLIAHTMFILSHLFLFFLKLIYSTVYHLTYILSPIGALLYLFDLTEGSLKGFITSSLWCTLMPLVLVSILLIVGSTFKEDAITITHIDSLIWLFGITFLLVLTPVITLGVISASGISSYSSLFGSKMLSNSLQSYALIKSVGLKTKFYGSRAIHHSKRIKVKLPSII